MQDEQLIDIVGNILWFFLKYSLIIIPILLLIGSLFIPKDIVMEFLIERGVDGALLISLQELLAFVIQMFIIGMIAGMLILVIRAIIIGILEKKRMCYYMWLPHADDDVSLTSLRAITKDLYSQKRVWYERFLRGKEQFIFIMHNDADNMVHYYVGMPRDRRRNMLTSLRGLYRLSEFYEVEADSIYPNTKTYKRQLFTNRWTSLQRKFEFDPVAALVDKMDKEAWIEIRVTPDTSGVLERAVKQEDKKQKFEQKQSRKNQSEDGQTDGVSMDDARRLVRRMRPPAGDVESVFDVVIQVEATEKLVATDLGMAITSYTQHGKHSLKLRRTPWYSHVITQAPFLIGKSFKMTTSELAGLFHLPTIDENE